MQGTVLRMTSARENEGAAGRTISAGEWRVFCREVCDAAKQLQAIAMRAEAVAFNAETDRTDPLRAMAREAGLIGSPASPRANTYATMMLGPFAALEELRRQIKP